MASIQKSFCEMFLKLNFNSKYICGKILPFSQESHQALRDTAIAHLQHIGAVLKIRSGQQEPWPSKCLENCTRKFVMLQYTSYSKYERFWILISGSIVSNCRGHDGLCPQKKFWHKGFN